ncbi:MAG: NHLP family bacteriocin export ABC transporter peptidase/permease/ATPase subunit [Candidatus Promineifilaceae bacterium]
MRLFRRIRRTPTVLQMEAVECGAAALGIILAHHGSYISLEELRNDCGVSRDGSKASNIVRAARRFGFETRGFRAEPAQLWDLPMPAIIHWNFNHFLVLEGHDDDTVYLNDPAFGSRKVTMQELDMAFTGVVITFEPTDAYRPMGKKPTLVSTLRKHLVGTEKAIGYVVLVSLALLVLGMLVPTFSSFFIDQIVVANKVAWTRPLLGIMLLFAMATAALVWLRRTHLMRLEARLSIANSSRFFWHILQLPITFFNQRSAGDINARIGQNDHVATLISNDLAATCINLLLIGLYALLMWQYSILLTLITIVAALVNFVTLRVMSQRRMQHSQRMVQEQGKLLGTTFGTLQQIETVKAGGGENDAFAKWAGYHAKLVNVTQEIALSSSILNVVPAMLQQITLMLILGIGGWLIMQNQMTLGFLLAFQILANRFLHPVRELMGFGAKLQETEGILNRMSDVLNYAPEVNIVLTSAEPENVEDLPPLVGGLEIRDLTFGYSRLDPPLIKGFSLTLKPGKRIALVGSSGSGKSTIARLIAGLYTPWEGSILFDGVERAAFPAVMLSNAVRFVDQEIFLFADSIQNNITLWNDEIAQKQVVQAAQDAVIHSEILRRENQYQFMLTEGGANLSGGQRQRIEIARALVSNPRLLIMDEATSALDPITELAIADNLRRRGCTCLIVAHRLSTIRDCDEIIVLDKGRVVERGTHADLWRANGVYARLLQSDGVESEHLMESLWKKVTG